MKMKKLLYLRYRVWRTENCQTRHHFIKVPWYRLQHKWPGNNCWVYAKHNLTEENLADYQDYFLYEKVLTDWFAHNPQSRFSLDDLGDVDIVETDVYEE